MKEHYMGDEIPIRWLKFEEALAADKKNYLSLDEVGLQRFFLPFSNKLCLGIWVEKK